MQEKGFASAVEVEKQELALDLTLPQYVELAKAELQADKQNLATSQQRALHSAMQLATTESVIAELERNYVQTKNNVNLQKERHEQGMATELALVDAEEALAKAKEDLILAKLAQRLEYGRLQRLAGGAWVWNR